MEDDRRGHERYQALAVAGLALAVLAPSAPSYAATGAHQVATSPGSRSSHGTELVAGTELKGGSWLESSNGQYRLAMRADGNLVLYWEGHPLWASNTAKHPGAVLAMQADGDLVVYQRNRPIWSSGTDRGGNALYYLSLQDNGNATINSPARKHDLGDEHRRRRRTNRARGWHRARGWVLARVVERPIPARDAARRQPRPLLEGAPAVGFQHRQASRGRPGDAGRREPCRLPGQQTDLELRDRPRGQCPLLPEPPGQRQRHHLLARPKADLGDEHHPRRAPAR